MQIYPNEMKTDKCLNITPRKHFPGRPNTNDNVDLSGGHANTWPKDD